VGALVTVVRNTGNEVACVYSLKGSTEGPDAALFTMSDIMADIPGAIQETCTPTNPDTGRRLRALVVFGNPLGRRGGPGGSGNRKGAG
jgi:hypothetical protein